MYPIVYEVQIWVNVSDSVWCSNKGLYLIVYEVHIWVNVSNSVWGSNMG